jgi:hypothetical protein
MMGAALDTGTFASAEACLNDAREVDGHIWGGVQATNGDRTGVWFRPPRKDTRNFRMTVKLFTFDGDPAVWNADADWQETTNTKTFASIPNSTRYDQHEISQAVLDSFVLNENAHKEFPLSQNFPALDGMHVPLPLREKVHLTSSIEVEVGLCTYTSTTSGTIDAYGHTDLADHDRLCDPDPARSCAASATKCYEYLNAGNDVEAKTGCRPEAGYRVTCVKTANAERASRMEIAAIVLFDESEGSKSCGTCNNMYLDGSTEWGGGNMQIPDGGNHINEGYQPAGNNIVASDYQWYRIESAESDQNVDKIKRVGWCNAETADLVWTEGDSGSATFHTNANSTIGCDISELGHAASTTDGSSVTFAPAELLNSLQPSDDPNDPKGYMQNFWIVHPKDRSVPLPRHALRVQVCLISTPSERCGARLPSAFASSRFRVMCFSCTRTLSPAA